MTDKNGAASLERFDTTNLLTRLLSIEGEAIVTVTAPLDRRRPGNDADRIQLRNLVARATKEVKDRFGADLADDVFSKLNTAVSNIETNLGADGVIIVSSPEQTEAHLLPFDVPAIATVADTPTTRHLVRGLHQSPRYRVLVISDHACRLFEGARDKLVETRNQNFPMAANIVPRDLRAIAGKFARKPDGDDKEKWRNFYRTVDRTLAEHAHGDPLPVVLAGVKTSLDMFEPVSENTFAIVGRIQGASDQTSPSALAVEAWPIVETHRLAQRQATVDRLQDAVHSGRAVAGLDEAWRTTRQGEGRCLVVEEGYEGVPSIEIDQGLVAADRDDEHVMLDPVDELIEHVARAGIAVEFVEANSLGDLGHIGMLLR